MKEPEWRRESDRRRRRRRRLTVVFRLRSVAPAYFVIVITIHRSPTTGDVMDSSTYYSRSHVGLATMSVRMENVAARKMNYKMMVSTTHIREYTHTFTHPLSADRRRRRQRGAQCACNSPLTSRSSVVRARARVLTWRATTSSRASVSGTLFVSPSPLSPPLFLLAPDCRPYVSLLRRFKRPSRTVGGHFFVGRVNSRKIPASLSGFLSFPRDPRRHDVTCLRFQFSFPLRSGILFH